MRKELVRLALLQIILITYAVLASAVMLKFTYPDQHPHNFASLVRDWGFLLFVVPVAWCAWAIFTGDSPAGAPRHTAFDLMVSGWGVAALLLAVAVVATFSAALHQPLVYRAGDATPKPSITHRQLPPDP